MCIWTNINIQRQVRNYSQVQVCARAKTYTKALTLSLNAHSPRGRALLGLGCERGHTHIQKVLLNASACGKNTKLCLHTSGLERDYSTKEGHKVALRHHRGGHQGPSGAIIGTLCIRCDTLVVIQVFSQHIVPLYTTNSSLQAKNKKKWLRYATARVVHATTDQSKHAGILPLTGGYDKTHGNMSPTVPCHPLHTSKMTFRDAKYAQVLPCRPWKWNTCPGTHIWVSFAVYTSEELN